MLPAIEHKMRMRITERRCCSAIATRCCWTSAYEGMKIEKDNAWLGACGAQQESEFHLKLVPVKMWYVRCYHCSSGYIHVTLFLWPYRRLYSSMNVTWPDLFSRRRSLFHLCTPGSKDLSNTMKLLNNTCLDNWAVVSSSLKKEVVGETQHLRAAPD